jgi:hypothetical protein
MATRPDRVQRLVASIPAYRQKGDFMKSVEEQFSELRTAAIASGKITAKQIIEATGGIQTEEQRLSILQEMARPHNITVPLPESFSDKVAHLTEKIVASGKVTAVQINASMKECSTEKERFESLQALAITKKIDTPRVERKNGSAFTESASSVQPTNDDRVQMYMKAGMTFRESHIMCGLPDPGPNPKEPKAGIEARAERWRKYCGVLSEADVRTLAEKGVEPV